jgi:hypothetical protein
MKVFAMTDTTLFARPDTSTDFPVVAKACAHWTSLRTRRALPKRTAIDPSALADALPHIFLAEYISPRVVRLRLCGHALEDMMGMDLRGMPLTALFTAWARDDVMAALEQVGRGARATLVLQAEPGFGQPDMVAQLALMPLTDDEGRITHVMGVIERHGEIGRRPRRFSNTSAAPLVAEAGPVLRVIHGGKG